MPKKISKTRKQLPKPRKSDGMPVTRRMLALTEQKLGHRITSLQLEMRAGFKKVDARFHDQKGTFKDINARFNQVDARFNQMEARFDRVDAKFLEMDSKFEILISEIRGMRAIVEEQNAKFNFALDGYTSLYDAHQEVRRRVDAIENS